MLEKKVVEMGSLDNQKFAPPIDQHFQDMLMKVLEGQMPVYRVLVETRLVSVVRRFEDFRPENTPDGHEVFLFVYNLWLSDEAHTRPWLWVKDGRYIVSDDYFWLAVIEKERPEFFVAQVLGEPLERGLKKKVGPFSAEDARKMLFGV